MIPMFLNIFIVNFLFTLLTAEATVQECGVVKYIEPQITGGNVTSRGEWPFIAALYYTDDQSFFCGGTIISQKHVLTAAHCVQQKNVGIKLVPEDVVVLLGAYNIDSKLERGVEQRDVAQIYIHPDWKVYHEKYDADIAIFLLGDSIVFTNYIRPVCLPTDDQPFNDVKGSIVGWGLAKNTTKRESIPRHAFTNALNDSYCYTTEEFIAAFSSTRTFCGGGDGSPNRGDSGGGFFVKSGSVWMQLGIISASLADSHGVVIPNTFSIYTNVKLFRNWITSILISEAGKAKVKLYCNYEFSSFYTCSVWESNVTDENVQVEAFTGTHQSGYDNVNVTQIWFWHGVVSSIPDGIGLKFQNLEKLLVGYDDRNLGLKSLKRSNFMDMPQLTLVQLHKNNIKTVKVDTLWEIPNLEFFHLTDGKLKVLPEKFFEKNTNLRIVRLNGNEIEYLPLDLFKHNPLIEEVNFKDNNLRSISTVFTGLTAVKVIDLHGNSCIDEGLDSTSQIRLSELQDLLWYQC
ncbi:Serine protease gd [Pseudolycoriella hygida]|uniref:Serine protease gd n=1 Tax=Pseudolycoriella hygida TaxID=35572 RepID=A0A9Q0NEH7_9DIPT|nr:Serine protease gd [Pseudolycoriella hygida]